MGMPQADDLDGGDGFNVMGLVHSLRRQLLPAIGLGLLVSTLLAIVLWLLIPVSYRADAVLRVSRELSRGNSSDYMIYKDTQANLVKSNYVLNAALRDPEISQLPMVLYDNYKRARIRKSHWLKSAISVNPDDTELIAVSMRGRHKDHTEKILNKVLQLYEREIVNKERMEKVTTLTKLRKRYQRLFEDIGKKTDEIATLGEQLGATDSRAVIQAQQLKINQLNATQRQLERAQDQLNAAKDAYRVMFVQSQLAGSTNPTENQILDQLEKNARFNEMVGQIDMLKDEVERLSTTLRPGSREIQQFQQEIARLEQKRQRMIQEMRPRIIERIKMDTGSSPAAIQREMAVLRQQVMNYQGKFERLNEMYTAKLDEVSQMGGANGNLEARRNDLLALQRDLQTVRGDMGELEIELDGPKRVTIVQGAEISTASNWLSKAIQIAGAWVLSLVGVIAAIAYWDYLSQKINGESDITRSVRVIGTLPSVQRSGRKSIEEAMRVAIDAIRTAILYNRSHVNQVVMVTSATGQEGRSTVASQLAVSMARAGKTTLLVDGDLRNPQQHTIFSVQPTGGLSEMLRGEQTSDQAIIATAVENVWLLSAGYCDQAAVQGLSGDQAKSVFQDFRDRFDIIIIDASPVLTSPDSLLLGQQADAAILSVRRDISQMPKVTAALDRLSSVGIPVLGSVVNGANVEVRTGSLPTIAGPKQEEEEEQPALTTA